MSNQQVSQYIQVRIAELGFDEAIKRLDGMPPQGPHRRLDRGHAEREPEQGGDTDSATASPIGGQGTGALERLLEYLEEQAADMDETGKPSEDGNDDPRIMASAAAWAADYRLWASAVRDAIGAPRPQSERNRVPNCSLCDQHWYEGVETECLKRSRCPFWAIRESDGASGPPNDQREGRAGSGASPKPPTL